ncbi:MAG: tetratricopeptide repeat protein, partial [Planctomycetota bacterium]|nr:tetratricopeptide repeat protein [Planctomycetota bacterium]
MFLKVHERAQKLGPYQDWRGPEARVLAGRVCKVVGASRLSNACHFLGWREHPEHPLALYFYTLTAVGRRDPWRIWKFLRSHGDLEHADADTHASWMALHAVTRARIRDFEEAERWMERAERAHPGLPWLQVEWAEIFEIGDRVEDALNACRKALEMHPWYRPAIHSYAHLLTLQDRLGEVCAFLEEAAEHNEASSIHWQLAGIQVEQKRYAEALASYEAFERRAPAMDKSVRRQLAATRCDVHCLLGDYEAAEREARVAATKYYKGLAERISRPETPRRTVSLPVGFVRQHHLTCAPATFATLANYWKVPIDHLALAEEVTYDGTPGFVERAWAEDHGWTMREFTVTWDSARALLDRGIPFTLHTADTTSGHAQAVIGYDELRETFLIRDPNVRHYLEFAHEKLLERQKATGPHGSALLPADQAALLDGLDLPDLSLHERTYELQRALHAHDREAAWRAYEAMAAEAPGRRLTLLARLMLAFYDDDRRQRLEVYQELAKLFPKHARYLLGTLDSLRDLARPAERVELLASLAATHEDPIFAQQYAEEIRHDAASHARADELLARAIRRRPYDGMGYHILADLRWEQRAFDEALDLYRFAACLDDKQEHFVEAYFLAARLRKKVEDTNRFLRDRAARYGKQSSQPARTLFWSLELQGLPNQGFGILDEGFRSRPDDGELMLYSAGVHGRYGHFDRAEQFLRAAKGKTRRASWLRAAAELEGLRTDPAAALELWKQVAEAAPLDLGAHRALALCLAETQGRAAALEHLYGLSARFPHHLGIYSLCIEWLREEPPEEAEPFIRHFLELDPNNGWARSELAWNLIDQRRYAEASVEAEALRRMNPSAPSVFVMTGTLRLHEERIPEARAAFREALTLSVEETHALARLMEISYTPEERREAILFYYGELVRQVTQGDGLLAFRHHARGILNKEEILEKLKEAHAARPDLWHAWSALARHFLDMNRHEEAWEISRQATERFPLMARLWLDHASVCHARKDAAAEMEALQNAYQFGARWGAAARQLSDACGRSGEWAKAREILEAAAARDPLDPLNQGYLAEALYHLGEKAAALTHLERAVFIQPTYEWAWSMLQQWSEELGEPHRATEGARALAQRRPADPGAWLIFAKSLDAEKQGDERMTALDQVVRLSPRNDEAHDLRAETLAAQKRWDEALAACRPAIFGDKQPIELRGRAAWIKAQAGRGEEAIADMRALLKEAPEYAWGWYQLVRWYYQTEEAKPYLEAAQTYMKLAPNNAIALAYLGDAWLRNKDRDGARAAFERACELDPDYPFPAASLFDMHLEDKDHEGAARALIRMNKYAEGPMALSCTVRLRAATGYETDALEQLKRLARNPETTRVYLDEALLALDHAGWARQASKALEEAATEPGAPPLLGEIAVDRLAKRKRWNDAAAVAAKLMDLGEAGMRAASSLMSAMAQEDARSPLLAFIDQHRHPLHKDIGTWGTAGYALATVREYGRCIHWLSDWKKRPAAEPWMLSNLALAHHYLLHEDEAAEVARAALKLQADHTTAMHRIWCALERAFANDAPAAEEYLKDVDVAKLKPFNLYMYKLAEIGVATARALDAAGFEREKARLREAAKADPTYRSDPVMARFYRRAVKR